MMTRLPFLVLTVATSLTCALPAFAAKATPDLIPAPRRQATVDLAVRLANRASLPDLPADLASPFNPTGFDLAEPDPVANAAAQRSGAGPKTPAPLTTREVLEALAQRLNPTGTIIVNNKPILLIDRNRFEVGMKFVVTYEGREYELQLASIDRTTFTLRYRGEEITRPIKPLK